MGIVTETSNNINVPTENIKHRKAIIATKDPIHVRFLEPRKINQIYVSCCYFPGLMECLIDINKNHPDVYVVCIGYKRGDFQIALTGTRKFNEPLITCVKRETFEELDIETKQFERYMTSYMSSSQNKMSHIFKVDASKCYQSTKPRNKLVNIHKGNNLKQKITVVVYGTLVEVSNIILSSRLEPDNPEKIAYYAAVKVSDAIDICQRIISDNKVNRDFIYKYQM